jgi:flagellar basal body P-ring formation protein FlgA
MKKDPQMNRAPCWLQICQSFAFVSLTLTATPWAAAQPLAERNAKEIRATAQIFLESQVTGFGKTRKVTVGQPDARALNLQCTAFQAFLPPGARAWGRIQVGMRCVTSTNWQIFVPAEIAVFGDYVAAARPLSAGQTIAQSDLTQTSGELTQLPATILTDSALAVGKTLTAPVGAGQPMRSDTLRSLPSIVAGQSVRIFVQGAGFQVASEGRAITQASEGQIAQARLPSGQLVSGFVDRGAIVVSYVDR